MPAKRVVSLCPSLTETIVAIGGLKSLAGVTNYCARPKGMLWGIPRIGGTKNPDIARIRDLRPDLVFANEEENRKEDVEALRDAGIEVEVSFPKTVAQVPAEVRQLGRRLGGEEEAERLAGRIEAELRAVTAEPSKGAFRYAYWIWKDPWMTVSDDTYVGDLIRLAGGENVYGGEASRYPTTDPAEAAARNAEVHIFPSEPFPFREDRHRELAEKLFGERTRRVFVAGDDYCWHGFRTIDGFKAIRSLRSIVF